MASKDDGQVIPDQIRDPITGKIYKKGRFFGKGGFAKCYELTEVKTGSILAGKIVSKSSIATNNHKDKMTQEITIHRSLKHPHVVGFHSFFEDDYNVYILLELCRRRSLMELHKRRKTLSEPEVKYFLQQILIGVDYLHKSDIIHRDLKLGNLFLNDELHVKIGDFGLATRVEFQGERKKTVCGTPNYIAPEIVTKKGHSFEVDVWSIGCIMYTLLFGKPPFETNKLQETYSRIKRCQYRMPIGSQVSPAALKLIQDMLQLDPKLRPKVEDILRSDFFQGYVPKQLPLSCLTMAPRLTQGESGLSRNPLREVNARDDRPEILSPYKKSPKAVILEELMVNLKKLGSQLSATLRTNPGSKPQTLAGDEATDPAAQPIVWITKWVDYSDKYGFGYQLSDDSVGVVFNDNTKLVMLSDCTNVHYYTKEGDEFYHTMSEFPPTLEKKMRLLNYFQRYMKEHLMKAGDKIRPRESDSLSRIPCMFQWLRTSECVMMHLNNGTLQVNFTDHKKVILCPHMAAVTYIDGGDKFSTYRFTSIVENGCVPQLETSLQYILDRLPSLENRISDENE